MDLVFISERPGHSQIRTRQLEQSKARAHAASVAWKRKRLQQKRSTKPPPQKDILKELLLNSDYAFGRRFHLSDYTCSTGLRIDPFYCHPWTRDEHVAEVLDWHRRVMVPKIALAWDAISIAPWAPTAVMALAESAMFSHASIATAGLMFDRRAVINARPSNLTLQHCARAMSMLRERLEQDNMVMDPPLLCTIMYLAILEVSSTCHAAENQLIWCADHAREQSCS